MVMFASDYSPMISAFNWLILLLLALVSLIPSVLANFSGPLLASPAIVLNLLVDHGRFQRTFGHSDATYHEWLIYLAPLSVGTASIAIWAWMYWCKRRRGTGGD